ncbi:MAG: carbamoyltransferase HypF [Fuerstia sp.]|nr:carbamoyltransferase HypF [Fuerstiella sp.]
MRVDAPEAVIARQILLEGRVQGLGVRPAIAKLALRLKLHGTVTNTSEGVLIHLEGQESGIVRFQTLLADEMPPLADFRVGRIIDVYAPGFQEFTILAGSDSATAAAVDVPTDLAMCPECASELTDRTDRRFGYAFSSCTRCGPRYSIIRAMPYERRDTSMVQFELCACCAEEFRQSEDRRFHAQTVACPDCGPRLLFDAENSSDHCTGTDAIFAAAEVLRAGRILALKGLGGYQLICDATNAAAVQRLREGKHRLSKPLAVMIPGFKNPFSPASGGEGVHRRAPSIHCRIRASDVARQSDRHSGKCRAAFNRAQRESRYEFARRSAADDAVACVIAQRIKNAACRHEWQSGFRTVGV